MIFVNINGKAELEIIWDLDFGGWNQGQDRKKCIYESTLVPDCINRVRILFGGNKKAAVQHDSLIFI